MEYRYETHCHGSQCSLCARSTTQEMVRAYKAAGYAGMVLTDHFIHGYTSVPRDLPWDQRMRRYYGAYLDAKAVGDELDFDVIFGIEHAYGNAMEVLIYGVELDFLLVNPDIPWLTLDELVERVHEASGVVIHAHPYRSRSYVNPDVKPRADIVDGIEVYNAGNNPGDDPKALALSRKRDYIITSGGDSHSVKDPNLGLAGIVLPHRVRTSKEFSDALKRRQHKFLVNGKVVDTIRETDLK